MSDPITQHEQLKSEQERITRELEKLEQDEAYKKAVIFKTDIQDAAEWDNFVLVNGQYIPTLYTARKACRLLRSSDIVRH